MLVSLAKDSSSLMATCLYVPFSISTTVLRAFIAIPRKPLSFGLDFFAEDPFLMDFLAVVNSYYSLLLLRPVGVTSSSELYITI